MKDLEKYRPNSMKLIIASLFVTFIIFSCGNNGRTGVYEVELYSTNDVHAQFFDSTYEGGNKATSLSKVLFYINNRRCTIGDSSVALLDLGDMLQGDIAACYFNLPDTSRLQQNVPHHFLTRVMEYMKYDAAVAGNHDIEAGHPVYDRIAKELNIPYLAANAIDIKTGKPYFKEYAVLYKNHLKIAVIGMITPNIDKWLDKSLYSGIKFVSPKSIADSLVKVVRMKENPDILLIAMHSGVGNTDSSDDGDQAAYIATHLPDVDFVLASHDHIPYCRKEFNGKDSVLLIDGGCKAEFIAKVKIKVRLNKGNIVSKKISGSLIPASNIPSDESYNKFFHRDFMEVKSFSTKMVSYLIHDIQMNEAYFGYSEYINFINLVMMRSTGADISFTAPINVVDYVESGKVDFNTVMALYPYDNLLYMIEMTGAQIRKYLEYSYSKWVRTISSKNNNLLNIVYNNNLQRYVFKYPAFNFDAAKGIKYEVDVTKPAGGRVRIISMENGAPFSEHKRYKVALSSYRANGGGELLNVGAGITKNIDDLIIARYGGIREIIYNYFEQGNKFLMTESPNWKFVPEAIVQPIIAREKEKMQNSLSPKY